MRNACLLALSLVLVAGTARGGERELSAKGQRSLKYLKAVQKGIRAYHIEGAKHDAEEYTRACWEAMVKYLEARMIQSVDAERSDVLVTALRRAKMADLDRLVALLDRFADRVEGVDVEELADVGAKGMFLPLQDPFSQVMDTDQLKKLQQAMSSSEDKTLGLIPTRTPEGAWKIAHVRGGTPAADAGLKIDDALLAIDKMPMADIPPTEIGERLQADAGATVTVTVRREGWLKAHDIPLVQVSVHRENVEHRMLPGKIGYIRAGMFNLTLPREMEEALDALEAQGMRGLVLDLRGNPGGALPACTLVADKFLKGGLVIATMETRHPLMPRKQTFRTKEGGTHPDFPMAVLINRASASASEMLSGALKQNRRAVVVGETSYGKGVGQSIMPVGVRLTRHKNPMFFYITLMEYQLPGGVAVQHVGIAPDVPETDLEPTGADLETLLALRAEGRFSRFADQAVRRDAEACRRTLGFAPGGRGPVPGLVELFRDQRTDFGLPGDVVRQELFRSLRRALEAGGDRLLVRPREDRVLCRGVFEVLKKLDEAPEEIPEYASLARLFRN